MEDVPRQKLRELYLTYGPELYERQHLCESLLLDVCGRNRLEIAVLVTAVEEAIPRELAQSRGHVAPEVAVTRLATRLTEARAIVPDVALWGVEAWALALGVVDAPIAGKVASRALGRSGCAAPLWWYGAAGALMLLIGVATQCQDRGSERASVAADMAAAAQATSTGIEKTQARLMATADAARSRATSAAAEAVSARATAQSFATSAAELAKKLPAVFGPTSGELMHGEPSGVPFMFSNLNVTNFIANVRLNNPYDRSQNSWDYGVFFRHTGGNRQYRLTLRSTGKWVLLLLNGDVGNATLISEGEVPWMDLSMEGSNSLDLLALYEQGQFSVNGRFVAFLDLSGKIESGNVGVVTGSIAGSIIRGSVTRFGDFLVREVTTS